MALITNLANVRKNRPLKPRYSRTQSTAQAVTYKAATSESVELTVGTVLARRSDGTVFIFKNATDDTVPAGICLTYAKEMEIANSNDVAMLVMGNDAVWECLAYDSSLASALTTQAGYLDAGKEVFLTASSTGMLKVAGAGDAHVCKLIGVEGKKIIITGCEVTAKTTITPGQ